MVMQPITFTSGELTENDVVVSNCMQICRRSGNRRLRNMLKTYIGECEDKVTQKDFLCRILAHTQRTNPPMRFMNYDLKTRKFVLMDAREALKFISQEIKFLKQRAESLENKKVIMKTKALNSNDDTPQRACAVEEVKAVSMIANLLVGMKGAEKVEPPRQGNPAHPGSSIVMTSGDRSTSMVDHNICSANKAAPIAKTSKQAPDISLNVNFGETTSMDIIFSNTSGAIQRFDLKGRKLFARILKESMTEYTATGNIDASICRIYSKLQESDPPVRFLRRNSDAGGFSFCDKDFAFGEIKKCFKGMLAKHSQQKDATSNMPRPEEGKKSSDPVACIQQQSNGDLSANQESLSLRLARPDPNQVHVSSMDPNQIRKRLLHSIATSKESQATSKTIMNSHLSKPLLAQSSEPTKFHQTTTTIGWPFAPKLPTPQSTQAAHANPAWASQHFGRVATLLPHQAFQFGSSVDDDAAAKVSKKIPNHPDGRARWWHLS